MSNSLQKHVSSLSEGEMFSILDVEVENKQYLRVNLAAGQGLAAVAIETERLVCSLRDLIGDLFQFGKKECFLS